MIKKEAFLLNEFCKSIGLHIKVIILANYEIDQEPKKHKNNKEINLNDNEIIFKNTRNIKINILDGSWKSITLGHYDSSTIRYELSYNVDSCIKLILIGRLKMYSMKK
jgi:hypothetical protein